MGEGTAERVMGISLIINMASLSLLLIASFPMALFIGLFLMSLGTEELFIMEDPLLIAVQPLLIFFALITLLFCLIITVGSRVFMESQGRKKEKEVSGSRSYMLIWAALLAVITALGLIAVAAGGSMDPFEAVALWLVFMTGTVFISIGYGLAVLHLSHFKEEVWSGRMKGLARLPPALLLLGFPAVAMLALLDGFPFLSVLLVFCWSVLLASLSVTLLVNGRTLYALKRSGRRTRSS